MTVTKNQLKEALNKAYKTLYDLNARKMEAEYTIQELEAQPEDYTENIEEIKEHLEHIDTIIHELEENAYALKRTLTIIEKGVDNTAVMW